MLSVFCCENRAQNLLVKKKNSKAQEVGKEKHGLPEHGDSRDLQGRA